MVVLPLWLPVKTTAADTIITLVGGKNAMQGVFSSYRLLSQEGVIASQPDILLVTQRGNKKGIGGIEKLWDFARHKVHPTGKK